MSAPLAIAWRSLEKGAAVVLNGDRYVVEKIKVKGKACKVTVAGKGGRFTREVKAKAVVELYRSRPASKPARKAAATEQAVALHDARGGQQRWATEAEGAKWDKPAGKAERVLAEVMPGAVLVGVVRDEGVGIWYVPHVDPSTIASHLLIFHNVAPETTDYPKLTALHDDSHARADLFIAHEHRRTRP